MSRPLVASVLVVLALAALPRLAEAQATPQDQAVAQSLYDDLVKHKLIIPVGVQGIFGRGAVFEDVLRRFDALRPALTPSGPGLALADVELLAPIPRPARNIFCVGKNYYEHAHEFARSGFDSSAASGAVPDAPIIFSKVPECVTGPSTPIVIDPRVSEAVDYEAELAVVIGKGGRGISREQALDHVFGYTIVNDVTARDLQGRHKQWLIGKS